MYAHEGMALGDIARRGSTLHPADSLSKALHQFRASSAPVLPVVHDGRLQGVVSDSDILRWMRSSGASLDSFGPVPLQEVPVGRVMTSSVTCGYSDEPLAQAWSRMEGAELKILPVVDRGGRFQGVVSRNDMLVALHHELRPTAVGGMATPLGVYLSAGAHRAGAGDGALFLTGVVLTLIHSVVVNMVAGMEYFTGVRIPEVPQALIQLILFLGLLRCTPMAGFHAAEHQVVHTIERGESLDLSQISRQPREHSRCGTNVMALLFGAQLVLPLASRPGVIALLALLLLFTWKRLGWTFQRWFTTRKPTTRQLRMAQTAAKDLLERYGANPARRASTLGRVWMTGVLQILAGGLVTAFMIELLWFFSSPVRPLIGA